MLMNNERILEKQVNRVVEDLVGLDRFEKSFDDECRNKKKDCSEVCKIVIEGILDNDLGKVSYLKNFGFYERVKKEMNSTTGKPMSSFLQSVLAIDVDSIKKAGKLFICFHLLGDIKRDLGAYYLTDIRRSMRVELQDEIKAFVAYAGKHSSGLYTRHYLENMNNDFENALSWLVTGSKLNGNNMFAAEMGLFRLKPILSSMNTLLKKYFVVKKLKADENVSHYSWMPWNIEKFPYKEPRNFRRREKTPKNKGMGALDRIKAKIYLRICGNTTRVEGCFEER